MLNKLCKIERYFGFEKVMFSSDYVALSRYLLIQINWKLVIWSSSKLLVIIDMHLIYFTFLYECYSNNVCLSRHVFI